MRRGRRKKGTKERRKEEDTVADDIPFDDAGEVSEDIFADDIPFEDEITNRLVIETNGHLIS